MGDPQSLHKYAYCHGDGVMGSDPSGNSNMTEMLMVTGALRYFGATTATAALSVKTIVSATLLVALTLILAYKISKALSNKFSSYWVILTPSDGGEIIQLESPTAKEVRDELHSLKSSGRKLKCILINGHAAPSIITFSQDGNEHWQEVNGRVFDSANTDLTNLLKEVMEMNGYIILNGCATAINKNNPITTWWMEGSKNLAKDFSIAIPDVNVRGSTGLMLSIPFTTGGISHKRTYRNGVNVNDSNFSIISGWFSL
jgi:preprotein translocase subunit SecG